MRWLKFAILIVIAAILQASLMESFSIFSARCNLLLILLVFFAIYCSGPDAIITSFSIGFAADIISSAMGPRIISYGLFGTLLAHLHRVIAIRTMPLQSIVIFAVGVLTGVSAVFLNFIKGIEQSVSLSQAVLGTSIYSALAGPFLLQFFGWWMRLKTGRKGSY